MEAPPEKEKAVPRAQQVQQAMTRQEPPDAAADMERLFREHSRLVYRAAYRVTGSAQDAEDVLQTVFLRLVRREGASSLSDNPGGYLKRAAVNAALDVMRSRRAAKSTSLDQVEAVLADAPERGPGRLQGSSEMRGEVRKALAELSPKSAEMFILRYFEGYDNHEIARMLGTSRSTVAVILHRTRHRLRETIRPYLGGRS